MSGITLELNDTTLRLKFLLLQSGTPLQDLVVLISVSFIGDLLPAAMKWIIRN